MEKLVSFDLKLIDSVVNISALIGLLYLKAGRKFHISFDGSKGYMSGISISAEGNQKYGVNRISRNELFTKKGGLRKKHITVNYCEKDGVVLEIK